MGNIKNWGLKVWGAVVCEQGLRFKLNFSDYLDVGLFLDHRHHRDVVRKMSSGKRVLNLFAYTGSFTCYAIDGGASETTTVDMSKVYQAWTRENFELNGFAVSECHRLVQADCLSFLAAHSEKAVYDVIVCDPPTFSNSKRMEKGSFSVQRDYVELIGKCLRLLSPGGTLLFSTNAKGFCLDVSVLPSGVRCVDRTFPHSSEDFGDRILHRCWYLSR